MSDKDQIVFWTAAVVVVLFVIVVVLSSGPTTKPSATNDSPASEPASQTPESASKTPPKSEQSKPITNWMYSTYQSDAGSKTIKIGCLESEQPVYLSDPYSDTFEKLCFRSNRDVLLILEGRGQLLSGDRHGARIRVGDGAPRSFSLEEPSDYSSQSAFIEPSSPLFAAASLHKKISIEATYYDAGSQTTTFTPSEPLNLKMK